jgi:hypothetical protein
VTTTVLVGVILLLILAPLVLGYRKFGGSQFAGGHRVLLMMVGVGAAVWLLDNITL